jgi:cytochrome b561
MLKNKSDQYGMITILLHWVMALLFVGMFIAGFVMTNIPKSAMRSSLYDLHKATGLLLFILLVIRISWRFINIQPKLPQGMSSWMKLAAICTVITLYLLMFMMPVSGFFVSVTGGHSVSFYNLFAIAPFTENTVLSNVFSNLHELAAYTLILVLIMHVSGAMFHQFKLKDNILKRMWFQSH